MSIIATMAIVILVVLLFAERSAGPCPDARACQADRESRAPFCCIQGSISGIMMIISILIMITKNSFQ